MINKTKPKKYQYLIQINYKSGNSIKMWFTEFSFKDYVSAKSIDYTCADSIQKPIYLNIEDIESIFQIDVKEI